jgi:hypothetical protein
MRDVECVPCEEYVRRVVSERDAPGGVVSGEKGCVIAVQHSGY